MLYFIFLINARNNLFVPAQRGTKNYPHINYLNCEGKFFAPHCIGAKKFSRSIRI